jgi:Helix-turn-helix domain
MKINSWRAAETNPADRHKHDNPESLMTVNETAEMLTVTPHWVRAHANGHRKPVLPSVKLGSLRRFEPEAIREFIRRQRQGGV